MRRAGLFALATLAPILGGCVYDVSRSWAPIGDTANLDGRDGPPATPFRTALLRCVADHHPGYLSQVESGGDYPISGWFLSARRYDVEDCMRSQGWGVQLKTVLFP